MTSVEFDSAWKAIGDLARWYDENVGSRNEATTRLQLIDRIIFDCLGWDRNDVTAEEAHDGQYADYTFNVPRKLLIVEAKKEGVYFDLPVGMENLEYSIPGLLRTTPALKSAMEQVAGYCQSRGVPYAGVSNGHQFVIFVATRSDGIPPFDGTALVFSSLAQMRDHFLEFWNLLSKPAIEKQTLRSRLYAKSALSVPPKLSATIRPYPGTKGRNPFQSSMKAVSEFILEDVARARELERTFLQACYCHSGALSSYSLASKQMLRSRYAALFDADRPGPSVAPAAEWGETNPELLAQSFSRRPILLIGDVGVGKTTFIRHLIADDPESFREKALALYIDLGATGTLASELRNYIVDEIDRQLLSDHLIDIRLDDIVRETFAHSLSRFESGVNKGLRNSRPALYKEKEVAFLEQLMSNREEHLRMATELISRRERKQLIIFLDNSDQRSEQDQQATFLIAQEMADQWQGVIYLTLRPETYHASMQRGALTGYHPKAFTVAPPRVDRVIKKRLYFGLRATAGSVPGIDLSSIAQFDVASLSTLMKVFLHSLRARNQILTCLENISSGNVRLALELVRGFFGSGHVDTEKILYKVNYEGGYTIPIHEFQRALIYGDNVHYDPSRSPVANLFDISSVDPKEHFLQPLLLGHLRTPGPDVSAEGFVGSRRVYGYLQALGFTAEQIDVAVSRCFTKRLVETGARRVPAVLGDIEYSLRLTSVGLYHIRELSSTFTYLDAVVVDTPILDKDKREHIKDAHSLEERLQRAKLFCGYLDQCWETLETKDLPFEWPERSAEVKILMSSIAGRA
jgi:hypothetical protein